MPRPLAVQFGAGNIGRGFLAQLYAESEFDILFVDANAALVQELKRQRRYVIELAGDTLDRFTVERFDAANLGEALLICDAVERAEIISTAVGAAALPRLAPFLAQGLTRRALRGGEPVNILVCENLHNAAETLCSLVASALPDEHRRRVLSCAAFVPTVVSRMAPVHSAGERDLTVRAEPYHVLPIDAAAVHQPAPPISGLELRNHFDAELARKLYAHNCAHAALGYLGARYGIQDAWAAMDHPAAGSLTAACLNETAPALTSSGALDPAEHAGYCADLLKRFRNRLLGDTCRRLARDPMRKLAPDDRLTGAARLCVRNGVRPDAICTAIAAALLYKDPQDESAERLRDMRECQGLPFALTASTGLRAGDPLFDQILARASELADA